MRNKQLLREFSVWIENQLIFYETQEIQCSIIDKFFGIYYKSKESKEL